MLEGKIILVSGGTRGLGAGIARAAAVHGRPGS
jgi:NAD(P)-dependent dehydrogenase (short-subunit alcohol dehydrogenase family)